MARARPQPPDEPSFDAVRVRVPNKYTHEHVLRQNRPQHEGVRSYGTAIVCFAQDERSHVDASSHDVPLLKQQLSRRQPWIWQVIPARSESRP